MSDPSKLKAFESALDGVTQTQSHRIKECLSEAFEAIEKHRQRKVPLKDILGHFNSTYGLEVRLPRFRQLLKAERASRGVPPIGRPATTKGAQP